MRIVKGIHYEGRAMSGKCLGTLVALAAIAQAANGAPVPGKTGAFTISRPVTCLNLAVYFFHGEDVIPNKNFVTLQEALETNRIVVHETGTVGQLAVENTSRDFEVFIQAGDIVKGGRQDRVLAYDLIVPPQSGRLEINSFCVEAGRWQQRGTEDSDRFSMSSGQLPGKGLRLAVNSARQQGQVWEKVKEQQDKLSHTLKKNLADPQSPSSLQLTLEDKDLLAKIDAYTSKLQKAPEGKTKVIGFALAINGKVESAEIYGSSILSKKMWPKMLRAAAIDALSDLQPGKRFEPADVDAVLVFLGDTDKNRHNETTTKVTGRIQVTVRATANSVSVETRDGHQEGSVIHRSVIAK
jgi:hypothetical protein